MSAADLLLWQPSIPTERIVRALRHADDLVTATVPLDDVTDWAPPRTRWRDRLRARFPGGGRHHPVALVALPVSEDDAIAERLHDHLGDGPGRLMLLRTRPELTAQWLHRRHVLRGGVRELGDYLDDEALLASLLRTTEALDCLVPRCDAVVEVEHAADESNAYAEILRRLDTTYSDGPPEIPGKLPLSARGVEILRRLNRHLESKDERKLARAFCERTFRSASLAEATAMPDEHRVRLEDALARRAGRDQGDRAT